MNSSSTISLLSKLQLSIGDIEEHVISIGMLHIFLLFLIKKKTFLIFVLNLLVLQATSILRASLITTSALTNGLSDFLSKRKPEEANQLTKKDRKV